MGKARRLDRILSNAGFGSRSEVKKTVKDGLVKVDGVVVKDPGARVDPAVSEIRVRDEKLNYREFVYIMMNKPRGVISATWDKRHRTVVDLLPENYRSLGLSPVGRLDKDAEGLMLLTNNGGLAHNLLSPKKRVPKRYFVRVKGLITGEDVKRFREGLTLDDGYFTLPASLEIIKAGEDSEAEVVVFEGKFHQIKRMFKAAGKEVTYLKRLEMGPLRLDENLKPGEWRELDREDLECLFQLADGSDGLWTEGQPTN